MALEAYDTHRLVGLIEQSKAPIPYYSQRFFGPTMEFDTEEVHFDEVIGERRMAPFVSPMVEGRVMRSKGSTMKSFRPAYVKPKHEVNPSKVQKRLPGEPLLGNLSPEQRMDRAIAANFNTEDEMIDNRIEWMATQILKTGVVVVVGEDYPERTVDFNRDPGLTAVLAGTDRWSDVDNSDPVQDLEDMSTNASKADHGAPLNEFYMDPDAFKLFRAHPKVKDQLDTRYRGSNATVDREPTTFGVDEPPQYKGQVGNFAIYVDARQYTDENDNVVPYLASGEVVGVSTSYQGVQAFGAIKDVGMLRPMRAFPKTWVKQDPSVRMTMTQSAPLPIAPMPNRSCYLKVN